MAKAVTSVINAANICKDMTFYESTEYDRFKPYHAEWTPELKDATALEAVVNDIKESGLKVPLVVDESGTVYVNRDGLLACKEAGKPIRYSVVAREQGIAAALSSLVRDEMTVLDEARLVGYSMKDAKAAFGENHKQNEGLSMFMKAKYGWIRHSESRTMGSYVNLFTEIADESAKDHASVLKVAREAKSVTGALKAINKLPSRQKEEANDSTTPKPPKADAEGMILVKTVKVQLKKILNGVGDEPGEEDLRKLHQNLREYTEKLKA